MLEVINWETNNCNTHIVQYLKNKGSQTTKFDQLIEYNMRNFFLKKLYIKCGEETSPRSFSKKPKLSISRKFCLRRDNSKGRFYWNRAHSYCWFDSLKWFRKAQVDHAFLIDDEKTLLSLLNFILLNDAS